MSATLFLSAREIVTCTSTTEDSVHRQSALLVEGGRISAVGTAAELQRTHAGAYASAAVVDCTDRVLTPGFVDSHTHAVFGGWRAAEYALRSRGVPYMEIARRGGGINASVRDVRERAEDELLELTVPRLDTMLRGGTTTLEIKSGYGLNTASELKQLRVVQRARQRTKLTLVPTFLGAHEFPPEHREHRERYVDLVVNEMIPEIAAQELARFCDVFMEPGVFTAAQARRILEAGAAHGLVPKLHADELENSGGAELAAGLNAASADHLGAISDAGIAALAQSQTVATLLPATLLFLGRHQYAPARRLIDAGATVALATDFNPGSSPTSSVPLVLTLACSLMGLDPLEAIVAATAGGARALRLDDGTGMLRPGAPADLSLWDITDHRELPYRYGSPPLAGVWKGGERVL
ncbi:MAG TPA: imidazolonepropionase [Longimicrobiales bacterium]|nr:imidazolonepropionase [Longimicrobiales bacterium]